MFAIPRVITAGSSYVWLDLFSEYSVERWNLIHLIRGKSAKLDVPSVPTDAKYFSSTITNTQSALLPPDTYWVQIKLFDDERSFVLDTIEIEVKPDFAKLNTYDGRSDDEKELEAVSIAIVDISNKGVSEYQIKGRRVVYQDLNYLIQLRDRLRLKIAKAKNKKKSRNSYISFS